MGRHPGSGLVVDGPGRGADIATTLAESGRTVRHVPTLAAAASALAERDVDWLLCGSPDDGDVRRAIEDVTSVAPAIPLVALLDGDTDLTPAAALDAGATDVVDATGPPDDWAPLLERRLDGLDSGTPDAAVYRSVVERLGADLEGLVCLFDERCRHVIVAGGDDDRSGLEPQRFDGGRLEDAGLDPAVETQLRANYRAARGGETRSRTVQIDGRLIDVETAPIADGFGLATYAPSATPAAFGADDETTRARVERLHETVDELDDRSEVDAACDFVVERAAELFAFDACGIGEIDDGELVSLSATAERPYQSAQRLEIDEGLASRTIERQETIVCGDIDAREGLDGGGAGYRSALSIPMGAYGVFQVLSTDPDHFQPVDRVLGELLVAYASHAIARIGFERALTRERDRFAALFQNIPDAAIQYELVDGRPVVESVNSAFVRLFGYDPHEAVGSRVLDLLVPPDERDAAVDLYDEVAAGNRVDAEVERRTTDETAPFLLRSVPVPTDGDDQHGYFIYTDISTLVQRERELERQNERLDAFASVVSHDLRNPLSIADGYLQTAIDSGDVSHLDVVADELDRMRRMIEDILTLARHGETIGEVERTDPTSVVEAAWDGVDTADGELAVGSLPTVEADPERLRRLFENVFRNAVLHGGDAVRVKVGAFDEGLYVADDGPGVPDDLKDEILEMGVSTAKKDGGTGFGLAIVAQIASGHGWSVAVADSEAGGAKFELRFDADE